LFGDWGGVWFCVEVEDFCEEVEGVLAELGEDAVAVAYLGQAYFLEDFVGEGVQGAVGLEVEGEEVVIARGLEKFQ